MSADIPPPTRVQFGDRFYGIRRIVIHPQWDLFRFAGPDLALLQLDEAVVGVVPIPIHVAGDEVGQEAHLVGNGFPGTFETGQRNGPGGDLILASLPTKRAATNVITSDTGNLLITTIEPLNSASDLEGSIGSGDSGGPLLIAGSGRTSVAGVASRLWGEMEKYQRIGGQDAYARVLALRSLDPGHHWGRFWRPIQDHQEDDFCSRRPGRRRKLARMAPPHASCPCLIHAPNNSSPSRRNASHSSIPPVALPLTPALPR